VSPAKIAANRANVQKSTGPRTTAGKARTRYNALQHGLSLAPAFDPRAAARVDDFRREYFRETFDPAERELATVAAEAKVEFERARQVKADLINWSAKRVPAALITRFRPASEQSWPLRKGPSLSPHAVVTRSAPFHGAIVRCECITSCMRPKISIGLRPRRSAPLSQNERTGRIDIIHSAKML
jgi:hypothetical protein